MVWYGMVWYGMVWYGMRTVWCGMFLPGGVRWVKTDIVGDEEGEQKRPPLDHLHPRQASQEDHLALPQPERYVVHLSWVVVALVSSTRKGYACHPSLFVFFTSTLQLNFARIFYTEDIF